MSRKKLCLSEEKKMSLCPSCHTLRLMTNSCCPCRFTTVADVLLRVREQLQKLQEQNKTYNSTVVSNLTGPMAEMEKFTMALLIKLLSK